MLWGMDIETAVDLDGPLEAGRGKSRLLDREPPKNAARSRGACERALGDLCHPGDCGCYR